MLPIICFAGQLVGMRYRSELARKEGVFYEYI